PEGHEHRLRRRADLPRSAARLPDGDRAHPLVRQARLSDARESGPGHARRLGSPAHPAHPSCQRARRGIQDVMEQPALARLGRAALPIVALLVFAGVVGASVVAAGDKLGFDFLAYHQAAVRLLNGQPLYDLSFQTTGGFGLFYYPPTFAPLILPFGLLSATTAVWVWTAILIGSFAMGVAVLPVSRTVRWWIVLLAGLSCSCCSRSAGAGSTTPSGSARARRSARPSSSSRRSSSSGRS